MTRLVKFGRATKIVLAVSFFSLSSIVSAATGDATQIPANPITNTTVQTPSATVIQENVANPAALPACPSAISNCPDINGVGGNQATCPDVCTITRSTTANPSYTPTLAGFVPAVAGFTSVNCPVGYFPGQQFNPQPDYSYMSPGPKSPVSPAAYAAIGGVGCSPGSSITTAGKGAGCNNLSAGQACCDYGNPCEAKVANGQVYTGSTACPTGRNTIDDITGMFYITSASISWVNCGGSCAGGCIPGTWLSSNNFNYTVAMVQCTPQPGFYPTGQTVNASTVCTRSKTHWKELNA